MAIDTSIWPGTQEATIGGATFELPDLGGPTTTYGSTLTGTVARAMHYNKLDIKGELDSSFSFMGTDSGAWLGSFTGTTGLNDGITDNKTLPFTVDGGTVGFGLGFGGYFSSGINTTPQYQKTSASSTTGRSDVAWGPENSTKVDNNNTTELAYPSGAGIVPIKKFDIKNVIVTPFITCYSLKTGYTTASIDQCEITGSTSGGHLGLNSVLGTSKTVDLYTYLNRKDGEQFYYEKYPVVVKILAGFKGVSYDDTVSSNHWSYSFGYEHVSVKDATSIIPVIFHQPASLTYTNYDGQVVNGKFNWYTSYTDAPGTNVEGANAAGSYSTMTVRNATVIAGAAANGTYMQRTSTYQMYPWYAEGFMNKKELATSTSNLTANKLHAVLLYHICSDPGAFRETVRSQIARFGMFFTDYGRIDDNTAPTFDDDNMFLGTIEGDGLTHGNYTSGKANREQPQYSWTDPLVDSKFKYDNKPDKPPSGGDSDGEKSSYSGSGFSLYNKPYSALGLRRYIINEAQFENLYNYLDQCLHFDASLDRFASNFKKKVPGASTDDIVKIWNDRFPTEADYLAHVNSKLGYGNDPRNNIVSITLYPCKVTEGTERTIRLGQYIEGHVFETNVATGSGTTEWIAFAPNESFVADKVHEPAFDIDTLYGSSKTITHPMGWTDFRAYEPYSRCELYIPFHGIIPINLADCLNKSMTIDIQFDTITGSSVAVVRINNQLYMTVPGQLGYVMPFSVDASSMTATGLMGLAAQSQANKLQATGNIVGGVLGAAGGVMSGNYLGAAGAVTNAIIGSKQTQIQEKAIDYAINHAPDGRLVSNAASAIANMSLDHKAKLIWHYPIMLAYNAQQYGETVGYSCARTGIVSSFSGYTIFNNTDLSKVSATEQEKAMILAQLQNGIII